jgi:formamidopyrimidine-DNA glycosylase
MPEGPEVAIMRDEIIPHTVGKRLVNVQVQSGRYMRHPETWIDPPDYCLDVQAIETSGKLMMWKLQGEHYIFVRAAMSGRWTLKEEKHNHIKFSFSNGPPIYFNDARNFGSVKFGTILDKEIAIGKLGVDPLQEVITWEKIHNKFNHNDPIGKVLLDQGVFNGVGNYLRSEALYAAKINPFRPCEDLNADEWNELCKQVTDISRLSYQNGGATIRSYKNLNGDRGNFTDRFHVYGRKTDSENRLVVRAVDKTKRAVWFVPEVQQ